MRQGGPLEWTGAVGEGGPGWPAGLDLGGNDEGRAVFAREELIRLSVADEGLGLAVEDERASHAIGDVGQVRQRRREVSVRDLAVELLRVTRPQGIDEVLVVRRLDAGEDERIGTARIGRRVRAGT